MDAKIDTIAKHLERAGFAFEPAKGCPWLESIEASFGKRLPEPYRSLIERYRFAEFGVPGFESFSNLGEQSGYDITDAPFKDPALREWLIPRGYLQIGRPQFANYDPVCFDMRSNPKAPQIVRFNHEDCRVIRVACYGCGITIRSSGPLRRAGVLSCATRQRPLNSSVNLLK